MDVDSRCCDVAQVYTSANPRNVNMYEIINWLIFLTQCVVLVCVVNIAAILQENRSSPDTRDDPDVVALQTKHWVAHVVRDSDDACTPCVVVQRSGHLVEFDTPVHDALLKASAMCDIVPLVPEAGLVVDCNEASPIVRAHFSRAVHHNTKREIVQQVLETHKCDLVPVHNDALPPSSVVKDAHAVLGIMLAQHHSDVITCTTPPRNSKRPVTPSPTKMCVSGNASESAKVHKT